MTVRHQATAVPSLFPHWRDVPMNALRTLLIVAAFFAGLAFSTTRASASAPLVAIASPAPAPVDACNCTASTQLRPQSCNCDLTASFTMVTNGLCGNGPSCTCCVPSAGSPCSALYSVLPTGNNGCTGATPATGSLMTGCGFTSGPGSGPTITVTVILCNQWGFGSGQAQVALIGGTCPN